MMSAKGDSHLYTLFRSVFQMVKIFFLFAVFMMIFYFALSWFNKEYQGMHRYDKPEGDAVKVFSPEEQEDEQYIDQLLQFYLDGV